MLGSWSASAEAASYSCSSPQMPKLLHGLGKKLSERTAAACGKHPPALELRLAGAWALQKKQRGWTERAIAEALAEHPWRRGSWRKERVAVALVQLASVANERLRYFGWDTVLYLSGANISAFLLVCSKIWDVAAKVGVKPLGKARVRAQVQSEGVRLASEEWFERDSNEHTGGRQRYALVGRIGQAIHDALVSDFAISNPGHTGFSLRESELNESKEGIEVRRFLQDAVSWAILEERTHTSKLREGATRRKWYLHPLLSPRFAIPFKRVKEPLYVGTSQVYSWFFGEAKVTFRPRHRIRGGVEEHEPLMLFDE